MAHPDFFEWPVIIGHAISPSWWICNKMSSLSHFIWQSHQASEQLTNCSFSNLRNKGQCHCYPTQDCWITLKPFSKQVRFCYCTEALVQETGFFFPAMLHSGVSYRTPSPKCMDQEEWSCWGESERSSRSCVILFVCLFVLVTRSTTQTDGRIRPWWCCSLAARRGTTTANGMGTAANQQTDTRQDGHAGSW